jgi:hypothetical protein
LPYSYTFNLNAHTRLTRLGSSEHNIGRVPVVTTRDCPARSSGAGVGAGLCCCCCRRGCCGCRCWKGAADAVGSEEPNPAPLTPASAAAAAAGSGSTAAVVAGGLNNAWLPRCLMYGRTSAAAQMNLACWFRLEDCPPWHTNNQFTVDCSTDQGSAACARRYREPRGTFRESVPRAGRGGRYRHCLHHSPHQPIV